MGTTNSTPFLEPGVGGLPPLDTQYESRLRQSIDLALRQGQAQPTDSNTNPQIIRAMRRNMYDDKNMFYSRLNSFGEYKYHNRLDTVFVLQLSFILMLVYISLHYLHKYGLFSTYAYYLVIVLLVLIFILIVLNRAFVLPKFRSTTNWNEYKFDKF